MKNKFNNVFATEYFDVYEIKEGIYAVIRKNGGDAGSNAGIVDIGDQTIVFDTMLNIDASKLLRAAAKTLTGREASCIITSHSHIDHAAGNQVFSAETRIISSEAVRELLLKQKPEIDNGKAFDIKRVEEIKAELCAETDTIKILNLKNELVYTRSLSKSELSLRVPDYTFRNNLTIYGKKRNARIFSFDLAHSPGDVYMMLEEDKVCFAGDLLFVNSHPWLGGGNPEKLIEALELLLHKDFEYYIPGHGDIGTKADVELQIEYIKSLIEYVGTKLDKNDNHFSIEDFSKKYLSWNGTCFMWNIEFLRNR
ncbi:MAG: MBL fold metallo-hydrolase [Bacillota bacterium]